MYFSTDSAMANQQNLKTIEIFGVPISLVGFDVAVASMEDLIQTPEPGFAVLANVNTLNHAYENDSYRQVLQRAHLVLRDGTGLKWAAKKMGADPKYNFVGTDFIPHFCRRTSSKGYRIYFLGARPGIAESAAKRLNGLTPSLQISGCQHGYYNRSEESRIIKEINDSRSDILLVAFGNPAQETWIATHLPDLKVSLCIGVGALFDYLSGRLPRAPQWMLSAGMEWVYRLLVEPTRLWRRYLLGNPLFVCRVLREVYGAKHKAGEERSVI